MLARDGTGQSQYELHAETADEPEVCTKFAVQPYYFSFLHGGPSYAGQRTQLTDPVPL